MRRFQLRQIFLFIFVSVGLASEGLAAELRVKQGPFGSVEFHIPCMFDHHPRSCLLDSGATFSTVTEDRLTAQYPVVDTHRFMSAAGVPMEEPIIEFAQASWANLDSFSVRVGRRKPELMRSQAIIGSDILKLKPFTIDCRNACFDFVERFPKGVNPKDLFLLEDELPLVQVDSTDLNALFDSGATISTISERFVGRNPNLFTYIQDVPGGIDATGNPVMLKLYKIERVKIGGYPLHETMVLSMDFTHISNHIGGAEIILGANWMRELRWFVDYANKVWTVTE